MLLDTSGLLCLIHRDEPFHLHAQAHYRSATRRIVHNYILAEFVALASVRGLPRPVALGLASNLTQNGSIEMTWVDATLHGEAMALLAARRDKNYSLCDAVSFVIMRARGISEALSTDHHFEQ